MEERLILSETDLEEIEGKVRAGVASREDLDLLLSTCRHFLSGGVKSRKKAASSGQTRATRKAVGCPAGVDKGVVEIFSDGACQGNPGPGGWGVIVREGSVERELSGGESKTTNNRMEMMGIIEALKSLDNPCKVVLTTDSQYVQKGITSWIHGWKRNGWQTADRKPVKNQDLWVELDRLNQSHDIEWKWIKGHNGHLENERCDELAREAIQARARRF